MVVKPRSSNRGRQTVSSNSGRQTVVVKPRSSNSGRQTVVVKQCRQIVVVKQWSSNSGRPTVVVKQCSSVQVSSSKLTTHDLQLRKVISPSFELRFGCSQTLWKAHGVKNTFICLKRMLDVRQRCLTELVTSVQLVSSGQLVKFDYT